MNVSEFFMFKLLEQSVGNILSISDFKTITFAEDADIEIRSEKIGEYVKVSKVLTSEEAKNFIDGAISRGAYWINIYGYWSSKDNLLISLDAGSGEGCKSPNLILNIIKVNGLEMGM